MRWFFLSMLVVYGFSTSGEYVHNIPPQLAPTYEGIHAGLVQIARLVSTLAVLQLLLLKHSEQVLMSGLYTLLYPCTWLGFDVQRFSLRLLLTLRYAEAWSQVKPSELAYMLDSPPANLSLLTDFSPRDLTWRDMVILVLLSFGVWLWVRL